MSSATKAAQPAAVNELVKAPDLVRTGPESRAELTAPDQTITRIGANTVFSFEPAGRNIDLQQGSILFHSPAGKGGGSIRSGGASAAVLGTTIIVVATPTGGFKVIVLEGRGRVTSPNGKSIALNAGQMILVLPGQSGFGPKLDINLAKLVGGSRSGERLFAHPAFAAAHRGRDQPAKQGTGAWPGRGHRHLGRPVCRQPARGQRTGCARSKRLRHVDPAHFPDANTGLAATAPINPSFLTVSHHEHTHFGQYQRGGRWSERRPGSAYRAR